MADNYPASLTEEQLARVEKANRIYLAVCDEMGLKAFSWRSFQSWKDYVAGNITEEELSCDAREDLEKFKEGTRHLPLAMEYQDPTQLKDKERDLARKANRIYKDICDEMGVELCFFNDFKSWRQFVQGEINEADFSRKARIEAAELLSRNVD
jgi:hypothetical protein